MGLALSDVIHPLLTARRSLGPVDKVGQPYLCSSQGKECGEGFSGLVVSGRNATELLEAVEHPLDAVSVLVCPVVAGRQILSVGLWRNDRPDAVDQEILHAGSHRRSLCRRGTASACRQVSPAGPERRCSPKPLRPSGRSREGVLDRLLGRGFLS